MLCMVVVLLQADDDMNSDDDAKSTMICSTGGSPPIRLMRSFTHVDFRIEVSMSWQRIMLHKQN